MLRTLLVLIFVLCCMGVSAGDRSWRKVNADNLYLRAGANKNFEILKKLKKGDVLEFVDEKYGWTKVILPPDVPVYVYRELVSISGDRAVVLKNRVNIRARPDLNSTILGQVNRGDILKVMEVESKWIKIYPPSGFTGWVKSEYLQECEYSPVVEVPEKKKSDIGKDKSEEVKTSKPPIVESPVPVISESRYQIFTGKISDVGKIPGRKSRYKLKTSEGTYYLRGREDLILKYMGSEVTIEGEKSDKDVIYLHRILDADN